MTEHAAAEMALQELAERLAPYHLPLLVIIGLPKTQDFICAGAGLDEPGNRTALLQQATLLVKEVENGEFQ